MKAVKDNGQRGVFSDNDWKSGQPQRYGWREEGKEAKTLPKEIVNFIERRKAPDKPEPVVIETSLGETITITDEKVTKKRTKKEPKTKSNDNPKQKGRTPGKHKPGSVEKA
jgi:hypothetical protein